MDLLAILGDNAFVASRPVVRLPLRCSLCKRWGDRLDFRSATDRLSFPLTLSKLTDCWHVCSCPSAAWQMASVH